jgi:hypothetical protein
MKKAIFSPFFHHSTLIKASDVENIMAYYRRTLLIYIKVSYIFAIFLSDYLQVEGFQNNSSL